jgi:hypothetical protein
MFIQLILAASNSACVDRDDAIKRAMEWVHDHIPYDAGSYHNGYVQGCMGIVGYAWQFPKPGVYSGDLEGNYCKKVNKDKMEKGDIMVNPGTHELLFDGWAKSDQSEYFAIELGGPSGSIRRATPWPYWSSLNPEKYVPCKVMKACAV